ncbi:hypothetical protein FHS43_004803 [Streptosporangium becharense]|uniref:Heavy metal transporter n=1 Tax=Streptosporangium becharense TaxID=1816182 RepID=A0A7W9MI73_9ACTN|nr:hypothetical protein [Streptosporangium becharense]MBB2913499.1 hypothetical protein [Streptosporangium becharense]MBB5821189.1 hypothetical protein [Streptosporangium becharense]
MTVLAVGITAGVLILINRVTPFKELGEGCKVTTPEGTLDLEIEQAQVASVIAAVAARRKLPERAVVIAYATAIQESKLKNLTHGDRDSVGAFQQRPSQGWGTPKQLVDPVYASGKFFAALAKVKNYQKLPLHEAAQLVQRSADGSAYAQHEEDGKLLAAAFTGRVPKAVHCWFPAPTGKTPQPATGKAERELARALGADATLATPSRRRGWLVASWSAAHAKEFGLSRIRYDGQTWAVATGDEGWKADTRASAKRVDLS